MLFRLPLVALVAGTALAGDFLPQKPADRIDQQTLAVCYSGFRRGQYPDRGQGAKNPSREEILEDLRLLGQSAGIPLLRLYDSKENSRTVLELIRSEKLPLKVMLGAWLDAEISPHLTCEWVKQPFPEARLVANRKANGQEVKRAIGLAREFPDVVTAVNIGNETLVDWNDHRVPVERLAGFLREAREALDQPVTTAENYAAWIRYAQDLAGVVDFAGVHTYPVWEKKTLAQSMAFTLENLTAVQKALPGIPIVIAEAGWATTASEFPGEANEKNQAHYFRDLLTWAGKNHVTVFWFEAFDEDWKGDPNNPQGAEKHWGLYDLDRKPKLAAREVLPKLIPEKKPEPRGGMPETQVNPPPVVK
jgi:exo-beta-1,3-glucanase (GH17 family)